ncbi:MAG: ABC transporter permease [Pseudohongiellaceae bacterium]
MNGIFLKLTLRNLLRDRLYTLINVLSLATGMACFFLVAVYIHQELNYDRHHDNYARIYRAVNEFTTPGNTQPYATALTSSQLGPMMQRDFPEIEQFVRFRELPNAGEQIAIGMQAANGEERLLYNWDSQRILLVDDNVFEVFSHHLIRGDAVSALEPPMTVVISESLAERYFGPGNPLGEILLIADQSYTITGVFENMPVTSHLHYDALLSINQLTQSNPGSPQARLELGYPQVFTYFLLPAGIDATDFAGIGNDFADRYMTGDGFSRYATRIYVEPLSSLYLSSTAADDFSSANLFFIYSVGAIGLLILSIACINYINLATTRSLRFEKSVDLQKLLGAGQSQLFWQFLLEALLLSATSFVIAIAAVEATLATTSISELFGRSAMSMMEERGLLFALGAVSLSVGLLSGFYPAVQLTGLGFPRGTQRRHQTFRPDRLLRQTLVFTQFCLSIMVLASVMIMFLQMNFLNNRSLGFEKDNKLVVDIIGASGIERLSSFMETLTAQAGILGATVTTSIPGRPISYQPGMSIQTEAEAMTSGGLRRIGIDENFLQVMGLELLAGRNLEPGAHTNAIVPVLVNETAVAALGWTSPIGKRLQWNGYQGTVVGVVNDFNFQGLHNPVEALFLHPQALGLSSLDQQRRATADRALVLDVVAGSQAEILPFIQSAWNDFDAQAPFAYTYVRDELNALYLSEQTQMRLVAIFAGLCLMLSCLGLFGLMAFTTKQRTKEVGIRKTLGATASQIILLFFGKILTLIACASVVASTIAWWVAMDWLERFHYRIELSLWMFVASLAMAVGIAFLTVAGQSWGVARQNPVTALRYE